MRHPSVLTLTLVGVLLVTVDAPAAPAPDPHVHQAELARLAPGLSPEVLALALEATARAWAQGQGVARRVLTVVDYSLPSTARRLWVFDLARPAVLHRELVAHGRNSGQNHATRFSNRAGSLQSSLGLFLTRGTYQGQHGYSLKLDGLELGFNDQAAARALVIHGAWYVTPVFARRHGRLGRSWGCPALDPAVSRPVIDAIKDGSLLFVYYPEPRWLEGSVYLKPR